MNGIIAILLLLRAPFNRIETVVGERLRYKNLFTISLVHCHIQLDCKWMKRMTHIFLKLSS
jgi:hypothetical protein